ncbi:hypothetical protein K7X08_034125 [Anisodus acutangulus]|uniref:Uncharacterized protein n=1 Tax=Anisodus acutangulus TaxID=402998 RepID=A0A9Q1LA47_9SOLA|nr:hypothetical protein K7X08_034125 [Anisodus acutangulus]
MMYDSTVVHKHVRPFLYPDNAEKSNNYIKNLIDYDDELPNPNIDALKREIGDTRQFYVKMELAFGSGHKRDHDEVQVQVQYQDLGGMVNALDGSHLSHPDHVTNADGSSSHLLVQVDDSLTDPSHVHNDHLPDQFDDSSCKTLTLTDHAHVHNDDVPSSPFPDQVDDANCKTVSGEISDFAVSSEV